ncbi:MAG: transglutaminase-like cysteine peptidase [Desulfobulbaceae bacterium]|nr:transglutaminase-like cysteine peptidase [Desulfobulbaceae bacterium]
MFSRYKPLLLFVLLAVLAGFGCAKAPTDTEFARIRHWQLFVKENRSAPPREKVVSVNNYFNEFLYVEDQDLYGSKDYWATMRETLVRGSGDCEDFAIAKYFTLRDLDLPEDNMRITYVIPVKSRKPHMVLTYQLDPAEEPLVLDTMVNALFPVSRRTDLVPVYSFNMNGYWIARKDKKWQGKRVGNAEKLSLWWGLLQRMIDEDMFYLSKPVVLAGS